MAINEVARHRLYQKLEHVLGPDDANALMEHLPPVGWADVATKRDVDALDDRMRTGFAASKRDVDSLEERMDFRFDAVHKDFAILGYELRTEVAMQLRTQLLATMATQIAIAGFLFTSLR